MTIQEIIKKCEENYDDAIGYHYTDEEGNCYYWHSGIDPQYANSTRDTSPTLMRSLTYEAFFAERPGMVKDYWDFQRKIWVRC